MDFLEVNLQIFPDSNIERVIFASRAEEIFYKICQNHLSEDWKVFYSVVTSISFNGLQNNEIDFILYHPSYGLIVAEIKGGGIKFDAEHQQFYSINRFKKQFKIKNPFKQILISKSRLMKYLKEKKLRVPISHIVVFPNTNKRRFKGNIGINKKIIFGKKELTNLEENLIELALESQPEKYLNFNDIGHKLESIFVGESFNSRKYIRDYIDSHESRVRDVETFYESLVNPISSNLRLGIEGEAGTGKTVLALIIAKYFKDRSNRVLLLTSNPMLNLYLKQELGSEIDVKIYSDFAKNFDINLLQKPAEFKGTHTKWVNVEGPKRLFEEIIKNQTFRYDCIICDEAQDVPQSWWKPIEQLLLSEQSRLYLFFDRSQGIFGNRSKARFDPDHSLPISPPFFPLVHNYRTTREISSFARPFRTGRGVLKSHCGRVGYVPELINYSDVENFYQKLHNLLTNLIKKEMVKPEEITLLSARNPDSKASVISELTHIGPYPIHRIYFDMEKNWREIRPPDGHIGLSTIQAYKGLETKVAILINFSEYNLPLSNPLMANLMYVACTRAKHMLYVFLLEDDSKNEMVKSALSNVNYVGPMVVEGPETDIEVVGTVSYYNSDRCGWLTVEDESIAKNNILFFPYDVIKADLTEYIKVGTKLIFRLKVEGNVMVAGDLKLFDKIEDLSDLNDHQEFQ